MQNFNSLKKQASFQVEGIDTNDGLTRFAGREERYKSALLRFAGTENLYTQAEPSEEFLRYIHSQKGVCGNLGMYALAELAKTVEQKLRDGISAQDEYEIFKQELSALNNRLRESVKLEQTDEAKQTEGSPAELKRQLTRLSELLWRANISDSEALLNNLWKTRWVGIAQPDFTPLADALNQYEFDAAHEAAERLLASLS